VVVVTLTFPARALRWRVLLGAAMAAPPRLHPVWLATAIGFMANNVLPARAGEVARAWAGSRLVGLPASTALSTIAVERVFDGVVVVLMLALGIVAPGFPAGVALRGVSLQTIAASMGALFAVALGVLALAAHYPERALGLGDRLAHRMLPRRAADLATRLMRNLFAGLSVLRSGRDFARVLGWSFVVWGINVISYNLAFAAFHLPGVPLSASLVLQGIVVLGVAVPSAPGFVGLFEAAVIAALAIYGVPGDTAFGFSVALHMSWFIPITALGLLALVRAGMSFGDLSARRAAPA
jgi:uncharacterized protein (TIRG00374 family)